MSAGEHDIVEYRSHQYGPYGSATTATSSGSAPPEWRPLARRVGWREITRTCRDVTSLATAPYAEVRDPVCARVV
jgi:hypothetical protein